MAGPNKGTLWDRGVTKYLHDRNNCGCCIHNNRQAVQYILVALHALSEGWRGGGGGAHFFMPKQRHMNVYGSMNGGLNYLSLHDLHDILFITQSRLSTLLMS